MKVKRRRLLKSCLRSGGSNTKDVHAIGSIKRNLHTPVRVKNVKNIEICVNLRMFCIFIVHRNRYNENVFQLTAAAAKLNPRIPFWGALDMERTQRKT